MTSATPLLHLPAVVGLGEATEGQGSGGSAACEGGVVIDMEGRTGAIGTEEGAGREADTMAMKPEEEADVEGSGGVKRSTAIDDERKHECKRCKQLFVPPVDVFGFRCPHCDALNVRNKVATQFRIFSVE